MTRIGIITQARMTSTRLPGKVLLTAGAATMLDHHLTRLSGAGFPVLVATTTNAADDPIVDAATEHGALIYRGDELDVLDRFARAASRMSLDVVVRVTSDCPLIDPDLIVKGVERFQALHDPYAYVSNVISRSYPRGFDFEVVSAAALYDADQNAVAPSDREHVTPYLYLNRSGRTVFAHVEHPYDASRYRVTLDTEDDLRLLRTLIEDHDAQRLSAPEIIEVLEAHPELGLLNAHVEQKKLGG